MKFFFPVIYSLIILNAYNSFARTLPKPLPYRDGEIILHYKQQATGANARASVLRGMNLTKIQDLGSKQEWTHAHLPLGKTVETAITEALSDPNVESAQPNYTYQITSTVPNDANFGALWGLKNTGQTITALSAAATPDTSSNPPTGATTGKDMDLTHAWDVITDCSAVIVAVIDTGIKYDHADLTANMWDLSGSIVPHHGRNVVTGAADPTNPMDDAGHGTHVAGTIGAVGNNGIGTTGICWKVQLMAIKALSADGSGSTSDIVAGISWALSHGAKVINLSIGGSALDPAMSSAIDSAQNSGTVVVAAAGNDGTNNDNGATPSYPCNFTKPNLICVAALDQAYGLASFSNYGVATVDVGAPGVNIASTWPFSVTAIADDFSSGWSYSPNPGGWGQVTLQDGSGNQYPSLVDPANWDGSSAQYVSNADHHAYKSFNLSGLVRADLSYEVDYNTQSGVDLFRLYQAGTGGDPVTSASSIVLDTESGSGGFYNSEQPLDPSCLTTTCSIGLRFTSDASTQATGIAFLRFAIKQSIYGTTNYNVLEGTSMATPHVTGLAAMLFAYNPSFTYLDVINAIRSGGVPLSALAGKTRTGNAVNAMGALSLIQAPTGVSATKL